MLLLLSLVSVLCVSLLRNAVPGSVSCRHGQVLLLLHCCEAASWLCRVPQRMNSSAFISGTGVVNSLVSETLAATAAASGTTFG